MNTLKYTNTLERANTLKQMDIELIENLSDEDKIQKLPVYVKTLEQIIKNNNKMISESRKIEFKMKGAHSYYGTAIGAHVNEEIGYYDYGEDRDELRIMCEFKMLDMTIHAEWFMFMAAAKYKKYLNWYIEEFRNPKDNLIKKQKSFIDGPLSVRREQGMYYVCIKEVFYNLDNNRAYINDEPYYETNQLKFKFKQNSAESEEFARFLEDVVKIINMHYEEEHQQEFYQIFE